VRRAALLAGVWLAIAAPAAAEPQTQLVIVQDGQGLSALSTDVAVSPDGRHVYAAGPSFVVALRRKVDGRLAFVEEYVLSVPGTRVAAPSDGLGVLAIASTPGAAAVVSYRRNGADGKLTWVENEFESLSSSAWALQPSRDGTRVYVTSPAQDGVVVYARDAATGLLSFAQNVREADAGVSGLVDPTHLAVSPDDRDVYAAAFVQDGQEFRETIALLRREPNDSLVFVEALEVGALAAVVGLSGLLVAPDGAELLALDGGTLASGGAAVLRFARDPDGRLSPSGAEPIAAAGFFQGFVSWLALRPDGQRIFFGGVANAAPVGAPVTAWSRDGAGALAPLARVETGVISESGVASPDGRFVYTSTALGARVLPEPHAAAAGATTLVGLALSRRAQRVRRRARASARA